MLQAMRSQSRLRMRPSDRRWRRASSASRATTTAPSTASAEALQDAAAAGRRGRQPAGAHLRARLPGLVAGRAGRARSRARPVAQALELASEPAAAQHFVTAMARLAHGRLAGDDDAARPMPSCSPGAVRRRSRSRRRYSASASSVATRSPSPKHGARSPRAPTPGRLPAADRGRRGRSARPASGPAPPDRGRPQRPRARGAAPLPGRRVAPRDRGLPLRLAQHRQDALQGDLPQARRVDPRRGGRAGRELDLL